MVDLTTSYLGFRLPSPIVASASPLTGSLDTLRQLEDAGVGAVVLPSLFEEQLGAPELARLGLPGPATAPTGAEPLPRLDDYNAGPEGYLLNLEQAKAAIDLPVIASLNGCTPGGWTGMAQAMSDAGADAIELNVYRVIAGLDVGPQQVDDEIVELVESVTHTVDTPVAVKLGPFHSAVGNLAARLADAGADGLVLFNRFYQPDIDLQTLDVGPRLVFSESNDLLLSLRWIAMLHGRVNVSLAAATGVHSGHDVAKALLAGADVATMASSLLANGPTHARTVLDDLTTWLERRGHADLAAVRGAVSQRAVADPMAYERANYLRTMASHAKRFR